MARKAGQSAQTYFPARSSHRENTAGSRDYDATMVRTAALRTDGAAEPSGIEAGEDYVHHS